MTGFLPEDRKHLETVADLSEQLAQECRVSLARDERNAARPEERPLDLVGPVNAATILQRILARVITQQPLCECDADFLNSRIVRQG